MEGDRDWVLNNLEWCVAMLEIGTASMGEDEPKST
jgi:hypothetical protein